MVLRGLPREIVGSSDNENGSFSSLHKRTAYNTK